MRVVPPSHPRILPESPGEEEILLMSRFLQQLVVAHNLAHACCFLPQVLGSLLGTCFLGERNSCAR